MPRMNTRGRTWLFGALLFTLPGFLLAGDALELRLVASGFERPLGLVNAGDGSNRLFLVEQAGRVSIIENGNVLAQPFLDISDRVSCCGGLGLLGLAFHPEYEKNGFLFAYYMDTAGDSMLSRFRVSGANPNRARASSERRMLSFSQPTPSHNGGDLAFGPDGYLYLASGDGSAGGDPDDNAQNLGSPLGKILRLDVDAGPGAIPSDNPFVDDSNARSEIWAYGLRNPWRISFDRQTGDFFIADVGQEKIEEVNFQPADSPGGQNYGWRRTEGSECFEPPSDCDDGSLTAPVIEYGHDLGCSVTGGYRYRGRRASTMRGHYLFGDFCSGTIWGAEPNRNGVWVSRVLVKTQAQIVTFGEDEKGELYLVDFFAGDVYRLVSREIFANGFESGTLAGWKRKGPVEVIEPGLAGSGFALAAPAGAGSSTFVRTRAPKRAKTLEASFYLSAKELDLAAGTTDVLTFVDGRGAHTRLALERLSPKRYRASLWVSESSVGERLVGSARFGARKTVQLEIDWASASSPTARDGIARLSKNGSVLATADDLATDSRTVTSIELGFPTNTPAGSSGRLLLDRVSLKE